MKLKLVDDVKDWWRWFSTWGLAILTAFPVVWLMSPDLQGMLPPQIVSIIAPIVAVVTFAGRIVEQTKKAKP